MQRIYTGKDPSTGEEIWTEDVVSVATGTSHSPFLDGAGHHEEKYRGPGGFGGGGDGGTGVEAPSDNLHDCHAEVSRQPDMKINLQGHAQL